MTIAAAATGCTGSPGADPGAAPLDDPPSPPPLPMAVTNNAVAALDTETGRLLLSFLGLDTTRTHEGVTNRAFRWDAGDPAWREIAPVPGPGRLAATAQAVRGRVYVFGGYTVAADGTERSLPDVAVYDPRADSWSAATPIPTPVDDAVSAVWRDSLVYLVSGWHDTGNESAVQIFDPAADTWSAATPIPGPPVFGHAGGISGDRIIYIDGTRVDADPRRFVLETSSWAGRIEPERPDSISWRRLPDHPGPGLYRAAAIGLDRFVVFAGGTDNPYNYGGIGYDGIPAEPRAGAFAWDAERDAWVTLGDAGRPTMDHRGLVRVGDHLWTIGGMTSGRRISARATAVPLPPGG